MTTESTQLVGIVLINADGAVLLQLRSRRARAEPDRWSVPGGHVEPGELPADAACRELAEETGLRMENLEPFCQFLRPDAAEPTASVQWHIFTGRTSARDGDIVVGEGQASAFVPLDALAGRDLSPTAVDILSRLLDPTRGRA